MPTPPVPPPVHASAPVADSVTHFSGKRHAERRALDCKVELRGGGAVLTGRAVDLSDGGVRVRLGDEALQGFRQIADAVGFLDVIQRHFTSGVEVRFPLENVRAPARVVRLISPPAVGGEQFIGCRFLRPLTPAELARVLHETPPPAPDLPLPWEATSKHPVHLFVYDPALGEAAGPLYVLRLRAASAELLEAVIDTTRAVPVPEVVATLDRGVLPSRLLHRRDLLWQGPLQLVPASAVAGSDGRVKARFTVLRPLAGELSGVVRTRA